MDFLGLASVGLGLYGAFRGRQLSGRQEAHYQEQAELNRRIGAFNAEIAIRNGKEQAQGIAEMTRKLLGTQRALFAGRGLKMEGSPMMVLGETFTMGVKQAQEAIFNSEVEAENARYNSVSTVSRAQNMAAQSGFAKLSSTINIAQQAMSLGNIAKYQESTGVSPSFNIFKFWE